MNLTQLTIRGLAAYRLTRLITRDEITSSIRERVWDEYPPEESYVGYLFTCDWCASVWAASALEFSRMIAPKTTTTVETVLALSAVTGLLTAREDR